MNMFVASIVFVILLTVALAHLLWAVGSRWPIRDPELLARTVIGRSGVAQVPRGYALLVAVLAFVAGVFVLSLADHDAGSWWLSIIGLALAALFLVRGGLGFSAGWRARHPVEPFASIDRKTYSPLSLVIGVGILVLVIMRLL